MLINHCRGCGGPLAPIMGCVGIIGYGQGPVSQLSREKPQMEGAREAEIYFYTGREGFYRCGKNTLALTVVWDTAILLFSFL